MVTAIDNGFQYYSIKHNDLYNQPENQPVQISKKVRTSAPQGWSS